MWAAWRIVHSPFGRVLVAIRDNPARARALGYDVETLQADRLRALGRALRAGRRRVRHLARLRALHELHWTTSGKVVLITVLGGIGTLWGGVLGAALVVMLDDYLASSGFDGIGIVTGAVFVRHRPALPARHLGHRPSPLADPSSFLSLL